MKITPANLLRWAGLSAIVTGILFVVIQIIHPLDVLESVGTTRWAIVHALGVAMGIFGLFGVTGIYARQVEQSGWLGLVGYLLLSIFYMITLAFQFIEAFISPVLATAAPQFVESFLGIVTGHPGELDLSTLAMVYTLTGMVGYLLGGVLFGIATFRAGVLPRWAGALLTAAVVLPLVTTGLIPHPFDRALAVPTALALAWLGTALWSEPAKRITAPVGSTGPRFRQVGVK